MLDHVEGFFSGPGAICPLIDHALRLDDSFSEDKGRVTFVEFASGGPAMHTPLGGFGGDDVLSELPENTVGFDPFWEIVSAFRHFVNGFRVVQLHNDQVWRDNQKCTSIPFEPSRACPVRKVWQRQATSTSLASTTFLFFCFLRCKKHNCYFQHTRFALPTNRAEAAGARLAAIAYG